MNLSQRTRNLLQAFMFSCISLCMFLLTACEKKKEVWRNVLNIQIDASEVELNQRITVTNEVIQDVGLEVVNLKISDPKDAIEMVQDGKAELAVVPNHITISADQGDLRTVLPLTQDVLLITVDSSVHPNTTGELRGNFQLNFIIRDFNDSLLFLQLSDELRIPSTFPPRFLKKEAIMGTAFSPDDIVIAFSSQKNLLFSEFFKGGDRRLIGLDDPTLIGQGSIADAISIRHPKTRPFVIPRGLYRFRPHIPILTIGIRNLLIAREDLSPTHVHAFVEKVFEHRAQLSQISFEYGILDESIYEENLSFPVHDGAERFLERSTPTFLQRYAESIGFVLSSLILLTGIVTATRRRINIQRKLRIERFYLQVNHVRTLLAQEDLEMEALIRLRGDIDRIMQKGLDQLSEEKLASNESFNIFLDLLKTTYQEINDRIAVKVRLRQEARERDEKSGTASQDKSPDDEE